MRKYLAVVLLIVVSIIFLSHSIKASNGSGSIFIGIPIVIDQSYKYWDIGYGLGAYALHSFSPHIQAGVRYAFYYWNEKVGCGSLLALELIPTFRVQTDWKESEPVNLYAQFGFGYAFVDGGATGRPCIAESACANCSSFDPGGRHIINSMDFAINFGIGIISNKPSKTNVEFAPMIHLDFTKEELNAFLSFNLGIYFGSH